jgi:hypothetical protein
VYATDSVWIIKPGENSNRGKGIRVARSIPEIEDIVSETGGKASSFILQ